MHDGQYMLPGEFAAIVAFLFAPPLLLAYAGQTWLFVMRGIFRRGRVRYAVTAYIATTLGSLCMGAVLDQFAPAWLISILRVRDLPLPGGGHWPVLPLAFAVVVVAAMVVTWWALRHGLADA